MRDAFHLASVIDCCSRCGDVDSAEGLLRGIFMGGGGDGGMNVLDYYRNYTLVNDNDNDNNNTIPNNNNNNNKSINNTNNNNENNAIVNNKHNNNKNPPPKVTVATLTALLKGYSHGGRIEDGWLLFRGMCLCYMASANSNSGSNSNSNSSGGNSSNTGNSKKYPNSRQNQQRQQYSQQQQRRRDDVPNVRTLNTLLRGCLWNATTIHTNSNNNNNATTINNKDKEQHGRIDEGIIGGVTTAEKAWNLSVTKHTNNNNNNNNNITNNNIIQPDVSSYEYSIQLLCQALNVNAALSRTKEMNNDTTLDKTTITESQVMASTALARACAMLGRKEDALGHCEDALDAITSTNDAKLSAVGIFDSDADGNIMETWGGGAPTATVVSGGEFGILRLLFLDFVVYSILGTLFSWSFFLGNSYD